MFGSALIALTLYGAPPPQYHMQGNNCILPGCQVSLIEEIEVPAQRAGILASLEAKEGMLVEAKQEVARIEDTEAQLELKQAEAELAATKQQAQNDIGVQLAKKSWEVSKAELRRAKQANGIVGGTFTPVEMQRFELAADRDELAIDDAEHKLSIAQANADAQEIQVDLAKLNVDKHQIRTPVSGFVDEIYVRAGEAVREGEPVLKVLRVDRVRVQGFLNVRDFGPEVANCLVTVRVRFPGNRMEEFPGKLVYVSQKVEPINGDFRVWAEVENRELLLRAGLTATMILHLDPKIAKQVHENQAAVRTARTP